MRYTSLLEDTKHLLMYVCCCRVLKPPGGGSSDIFGSGDSGEPQRRGRNHNFSSFSLGGEEVATPARKPGNDSFHNLFGTNEPQSRPSTAVKDKFRSNVLLDTTDNTSTTAKKTLFVGDNSTDKETSTAPNNNGECLENEKNGNEPSCDGCEGKVLYRVEQIMSTLFSINMKVLSIILGD